VLSIVFVSVEIYKNMTNTYNNTPLYKTLSAFYPVQHMHSRAFLSHPDSSAFDVIVIPFQKEHVPLIREIGNVPCLQNKVIIYFYRNDKDMDDVITEQGHVINTIAASLLCVTTLYCFAHRVKDIVKNDILELLDYESHYTKMRKFLLYLYHARGRDIFKQALSRVSRHRIFHYMDNIIHLSGKKKVEYERDEFVVVCMVKNGELYIESFIEYYTQLGAKHIYFIDNGSSDNTVPLCKDFPHVSVYLTTLSFPDYECEIRNAFIRYVCHNRWCLYVDIDEFFDYPYSHKISMEEFLGYLNFRRYTAVYLFMLTLYARKNLLKESLCKGKLPEELKDYRFLETCLYYDLDNVIKDELKEYAAQHRLTISPHSPGFHLKKNKAGDTKLLFKHSLFFVDDTIVLFKTPHICENARIADVSCVLKHYKLFASSYDNVYTEESREFTYIHELIENNTIVVSDEFRVFVNPEYHLQL
jgi:hypothetical protein